MIFFIPNKLKVENRPELSDLPLNVLLHNAKQKGDEITHGTALYEPDFNTLYIYGSKKQMDYKSIYDPRYKLVISYDTITRLYTCRKYFGNEVIGIAYGYNWKTFFVHVGEFKLHQGERCELEKRILTRV